MKKLITVILALACMFTLFSCGGDDEIKKFKTALDSTVDNIETVTVEIDLETAVGTLEASFVTKYNDDKSCKIEYSYEKLLSSSEGEKDEWKKTFTGTLTCDKDGNYSDGGDIAGSNAFVTGAKINIDAKKMTYTIAGNVLTATVKAENTAVVLGEEIAADVQLIIAMSSDGKISSYTMTYETEQGKTTIACAYAYKAAAAE